ADEMKRWAADFARVQHSGLLSPQPPSATYQSLLQLSAAMHVAAEQGTRAFQSFQDSVNGPLNHAINELTALMTPARWAYPDIDTQLDGDQFDQKIDGSPASLLLNTAELNSSALSLFILCAFGRKENLLHTIVLDDPFENMDELTTTHVARALTRFLRLWNTGTRLDSWQILLFLHGAENVERMRAETPCVTYFLPWLTPVNLPQAPGTIESEPTRFPLLPS
ncbi:MAG: hypothetical protein JWO82_367, partial [Akkermansiaceae bacterium]|nr:hypothetical protein [Akkermansiaceae bacterium]